MPKFRLDFHNNIIGIQEYNQNDHVHTNCTSVFMFYVEIFLSKLPNLHTKHLNIKKFSCVRSYSNYKLTCFYLWGTWSVSTQSERVNKQKMKLQLIKNVYQFYCVWDLYMLHSAIIWYFWNITLKDNSAFEKLFSNLHLAC